MFALVCPMVARSQPQNGQPQAGQQSPTQPPQQQVNAPQEIKFEEVAPLFSPADREVLENWKANPGQPADRPRILTALDTLQLSQIFFGFGPNGQNRFLVTRIVVANLTAEPLRWKRDDVVLSVDGNPQSPHDASQQMQFQGVQLGNRTIPLRETQMPEEVEFPPRQVRSLWLLFPEIPGGGAVPRMQLKLKFGADAREYDLNAVSRERLKISVTRRGPRRALAMVSVAGEMDKLGAGVLAEQLDQLAGEKVTRVVVLFQPEARIPDQQLQQWLQSAAAALGRGAQIGESPFPSLPSSLRELHLARLPQPGQNQPNQPTPGGNNPLGQAGTNPPPSPPPSVSLPILFELTIPGQGRRIHDSELDAVIAALRTAFTNLPRSEVEASVGSPDVSERTAALVSGAGRLATDRLPLILDAATHDELPVQQAALVALGQFGDEAALGRLVATARKGEEPLCSTALASLANSRFATATETLLQLLSEEPPELKKKIVKTFASFPRAAWSPALYDFVVAAQRGDEPAPPPDLLSTALTSLVQVGHPRLSEILRDSLQAANPNLRQQALDVLVGRPDRESERVALGYTLKWLSDEERREEEPASSMFQLLARVKDARAIPLLQSRFEKSKNRLPLLQTLATIGDLETSRWLREKYAGLQPNEKGEVLRLMSRLNKPEFREMAREALASQDSTLWNYAFQGLQEDGSSESIEMLVKLLEKSEQPGQFTQLMYVLANTGTSAARQALIKARDAGNADKRNVAINALQNMRNRSPGYQSYSQAHNLMQQQKYKDAVEHFTASLQADPQFSDSLAERGLCQLYLKQYPDALTDFTRCLELDPYNHLAVTGECLTLVLGPGKVAEACEKIAAARPKFSNNPTFHYNAACVAGRAAEHVAKQEASAERDAKLAEYRQSGLADLKKSIELGFRDYGLMAKDEDLKPFHDLPEWQDLQKNLPKEEEGAKPQPARAPRAAAALRNVIQQRIRQIAPQ